MRKLYLCLVVPALLVLPVAATAGELKLSIRNGLVTMSAQNVPLSMVMSEWARIGQTKVVNGEKVLTPVSLEIVDMPERKALDLLLRSVSGYMLAERSAPLANASAFDRIMILPTSRAPMNTGVTQSVPQPFNNVPRPMPAQPMPPQPMPDMDDEGPENMPPGMGPESGAARPGPQPPIPGQDPVLPGNAPLTSPRPGQLPQPAPQQPVPFGAPRPPGGGGGPVGGPAGPGGTPGGGPGGPGGGPGGGI